MQRFGIAGSQCGYKMFFMKINCSLLLYTFLILLLASCAKTNTIPDQKTQIIVLPPNGASVINASNAFAFEFFHSMLKNEADRGNKIISPLSIYLALSMVYNGADHATKDSIEKVLQLKGIDINSLNAVCNTLISSLPGEDNKVRLDIANSIWYRKNSYQPFTSFLNLIRNDYQATVSGLNFDDPNAVNTINNWVSEKTNGKISTVLQSISPADLMFLINAIYFNGRWKYAFNGSNTTNDAFYLQDGTQKAVPFMKQTIRTKMFTDSAYTILELPYGGGKAYSMYLLTPFNHHESLKTFALAIDQNRLSEALNKMDSASVNLQMPKWEYAYELNDMRPELSMLGMGIAFSGAADFSKIYDRSQISVYISKAIHKAYIKVNEEGTEAAAVTVIGMEYTNLPAAPPVFKLDHPFLYAIIEKQTGAVLFLGMVNDPASR